MFEILITLQFYERKLFKTNKSRSIKAEFPSKTFKFLPSFHFLPVTLIFLEINIKSLDFLNRLNFNFFHLKHLNNKPHSVFFHAPRAVV